MCQLYAKEPGSLRPFGASATSPAQATGGGEEEKDIHSAQVRQGGVFQSPSW